MTTSDPSSGTITSSARAGRPKIAPRLPILLEETVRHLTASCTSETENTPGIAKPVPFLVVRTHPMLGPAGLFIGVHVDRATNDELADLRRAPLPDLAP